MAPGYKRALEFVGRESVYHMKTEVSEHVSSRKEQLFHQASRTLRDDITDLKANQLCKNMEFFRTLD